MQACKRPPSALSVKPHHLTLTTPSPRHAPPPLSSSSSLLLFRSSSSNNPWQPPKPPSQQQGRHLFFSTSASTQHTNSRIFDPIRSNDSFHTHLSLSASLGRPLLTLWTASWCPTCRSVEPLLRTLITSGVGESHGGVLFAPIEFDAPEMTSSSEPPLAMTFMITSIPTLLSFDAGEPQTSTKVTDARSLADRQFLVEWICNEAQRHGGVAYWLCIWGSVWQ
ncbi:hypothetical protein PT974_01150 [Cladobotryum mycophilum]|uniref:Thioredoxin domain-containing protein n=1 Tax=Cladobotryum mycophilum TaxID=491253 RepID=A0ABR0T2U2_9HYPO